MTVIENYYQRIVDSKCPSSIRKQIVAFYNSTWTPKAISPQLEAKIVVLRAFFRETTGGEKITVQMGEEMAETTCDYGISEKFKTTYFVAGGCEVFTGCGWQMVQGSGIDNPNFLNFPPLVLDVLEIDAYWMLLERKAFLSEYAQLMPFVYRRSTKGKSSGYHVSDDLNAKNYFTKNDLCI